MATGKVVGKTERRHRAREFLGLRRHPRVHFHFTPSSASWMNQIETWFGILSREALARGSFEAVRTLVAAIEDFIRTWARATPFVWVKTADEILAKAVPKPKETSVTGH